MYKLETQRLEETTVSIKKFPYSTILDLTSAVPCTTDNYTLPYLL